jgi:hypothetical protein
MLHAFIVGWGTGLGDVDMHRANNPHQLFLKLIGRGKWLQTVLQNVVIKQSFFFQMYRALVSTA